MTAAAAADELARERPEWRPWLAVLNEMLLEIGQPHWDEAVRDAALSGAGAKPLLCGAAIRMDRGALTRFVDALCRTAGAASARRKSGSESPRAGALFEHAINSEERQLRRLAAERGGDPDAFASLAALVPLPFLHACRARWADSPRADWSEGYCPVCGAWPAFADICGIERSRYLRCGRCGAAWQWACLRCAYCGMQDHHALASLVVEGRAPASIIEACRRCLGYVKTFSRLQSSPPEQVMIDDLASAELDFCAARRGYHRPSGLGCTLAVKLAE
jgi:FdhE protein